MGIHRLPIRVRYHEVDPMGFVHHANYFVYLEMGRTELLRATGLTYRDLEAEGRLLVVVNVSCRFRSPARYDDLLSLETRVERITSARIDHAYRLLKEDGTTVLEATTTLACVDREGRLQHIPEVLLSMASDGGPLRTPPDHAG